MEMGAGRVPEGWLGPNSVHNHHQRPLSGSLPQPTLGMRASRASAAPPKKAPKPHYAEGPSVKKGAARGQGHL